MENQNNYRRPQDDIPYEQRMKFIIQGYRKLYEDNEKLVTYLKQLEQEIEEYKELLSVNKQRFEKKNRELVEKRREMKRLSARITFLEEKLLEYGIDLRTPYWYL